MDTVLHHLNPTQTATATLLSYWFQLWTFRKHSLQNYVKSILHQPRDMPSVTSTVKFTLKPAMKAQRGGTKGIALLFL
jgi:hypothetical protein